jgi:hypothetical protein
VLDIVENLLRMEADVVVTITAPLNRRHPGNDADRVRVRNLVKDARTRLLISEDSERARMLVEQLETAAVAAGDVGGRAHGVVIVATPTLAETHLLPFPVPAAVSLGSTPATRHLIQGLCRSPRYRVLVVSDRATRLFEADRDKLVEFHEHGFPLRADIMPRDRRAVAGKFALAPGRDDKESWRKFYRRVDQGLTEASRRDALPLVLAGVKSSTSLFETVSANARSVIGRIDGAHEHTTPHDLGEAAWPIMQASLEARRDAVVAELNASSAVNAVWGIDEVWRFGRQARGRIVEEDYRAEPAIEADGRLVAAGTEVGPDVMDDPVDEIIEHVVRAGGATEFVAPDALAEHGRIALLLR